eukprot:COSAG04_NODE_16223_length_506_cov_0.828010_1_plen_23_part_10
MAPARRLRQLLNALASGEDGGGS